ncbi:hypothetical protein Tco_0183334 [Tanacetum coccineum]
MRVLQPHRYEGAQDDLPTKMSGREQYQAAWFHFELTLLFKLTAMIRHTTCISSGSFDRQPQLALKPETEMFDLYIAFVIELNLAPPTKELHVVSIRSVYSTKINDGKEMLQSLINNVGDATGKEDLLTHIRVLSLQKIAIENGQRVLLAAGIQYTDARWKSRYLKIVEVFNDPHAGINGLISSFVKVLQWREKSDWTGYKELGVEKSGSNP